VFNTKKADIFLLAIQWFNGLLFHMTQPTSRNTTRRHCTSKPSISEY